MTDLIPWLLTIEQKARDLYAGAAIHFADDPDLVRFLNQLAEDEALHFQTLQSADAWLRTENYQIPEPVLVGDLVAARVVAPFNENLAKLAQGTLTKAELLEGLSLTEFSEWNHLFLYVVNVLKGISREYQQVAARMQQHQKKIESFLVSQPAGREYVEKIRGLQPVWQERILIMDDSEPIRELLSLIIGELGQVDTAENGEEALRKTRENYYDLIISDVNTPRMNGIDFFRAAVREDVQLGHRFLFYTGYPSVKDEAFFAENGLPYLLKPVSIQTLRTKVAALLARNRRFSGLPALEPVPVTAGHE